tara:strand:+ start:660 stop:860 length:201 start_codon:yes stop_codon:yes gene_type:complete
MEATGTTQEEIKAAEAMAAANEARNRKMQVLSFCMEMTRGFSTSVENLLENSAELAAHIESIDGTI